MLQPRMPATLPRFALVALLATLATGVAAQATLTVGTGGYAQIFDATAAANPGDVILVQAGNYLSFPVTKALTIRAVVPGTVHVPGPLFTQITPPPGQHVHVVGLDFGMVVVAGSRATFDQCVFTSPSRNTLFVAHADVTLQACTVRNLPPPSVFSVPGPAITVQSARLAATNCAITGSAATPSHPPGSAIELLGSTLHGSQLAIASGAGSVGTAAIVADAASTFWLRDSTISCDPGACPVVASAGRVDHCTLTPVCANVGTGFVLGASCLQPPQSGGGVAVEFATLPGTLVAVFASDDVGVTILPDVEQPAGLNMASGWYVGQLLAGTNGVATGTWLLPAVPALANRTLWLQGVSGSTLPLQASPVIGGVIR